MRKGCAPSRTQRCCTRVGSSSTEVKKDDRLRWFSGNDLCTRDISKLTQKCYFLFLRTVEPCRMWKEPIEPVDEMAGDKTMILFYTWEMRMSSCPAVAKVRLFLFVLREQNCQIQAWTGYQKTARKPASHYDGRRNSSYSNGICEIFVDKTRFGHQRMKFGLIY